MENLISPWRLPPTIPRESFNLLRQILTALIQGGEGLAPALRRLGPEIVEDFRHLALAPWLFRVIAQSGLQAQVAESLLAILRSDYARALGSSDREGQEILQVVGALRQVGVEVILLKGADLRLRLYHDAAARPMADLDLLVSLHQVPLTCETLENMGFRLQPMCADPRPGFRQRFRRELQFDPPPNLPLLVDLHWQLDYPDHYYPLPFPRLNQKALHLDFSGCPVKVLCPEHAYILLLLHACDGFHGAMQLVDFVLAPQLLKVNWGNLIQETVEFHCQAPVYLVLREISRLVPEAVPHRFLTQLSSYAPSWAERLVLRRTLGELTRHFVTLYRHRGFRDRLFYLSAVLCPDSRYLTAMYGKPRRTQFLKQTLSRLFSSERN